MTVEDGFPVAPVALPFAGLLPAGVNLKLI